MIALFSISVPGFWRGYIETTTDSKYKTINFTCNFFFVEHKNARGYKASHEWYLFSERINTYEVFLLSIHEHF
jgi:hypothetical protein